MSPYFNGLPDERGGLGYVEELKGINTFNELVHWVSANPIPVPYRQSQFLRFDKEKRDHIKKVRHLVPGVFTQSRSPRHLDLVTHCNLMFLDVDDPKATWALLAQGWNLLKGLKYCVWETANSTKACPRLRLMVSARAIPAGQYAQAVTALATRLGTPPTKESLKAHQPMYLPLQFAGEEDLI